MKKLILPGWGLIICAAILGLIFTVEFGANRMIKDKQDGVEVVCNPQSLVVRDKILQLRMDCNGREVFVGSKDQSNAITAVMNKELEPITCTQYVTNRVVCEPPKEN